MFALGVLSEAAREVADNRVSAQNWFRQAAERGHSYGQLMLGRYLARGMAGSTDLLEARRWLQSARGAGVIEAELELARLPGPDAVQPSVVGAAAA